ncbi:ABC transporter ATP-binding protein [Dinghuibacter silviterrae]|uniref:Osmoprotectant transport system ATP-binding protein n=1 Tax=Dinghuibacter silviterrae TaxID=1539049 RepID=A0A4V3GM75_9BACT|nr:ABC transporter ATP-binding protein [Dinghuibacter silviterrae]TDX02373.1 osmoprotectant transport system ATP-binding protein [Dinghuibacter silviterrae]
MIKLDRVVKEYTPGKPVVNQVSFDVGEGETLVLLGTSGSGKTTTLRMINRLVEPSSGQIFVGGKDIRDVAPETLRRGMGYVLQQSSLFPHYTVAENVAVVPRLLRWDARRMAERTTALLEKLHLPPGQYLNAYPAELSGGQAQRVGLARALAADQPILLMDEPFGALDPITRAHVRRDFRGLDEVQKKTVLLVTHDVTEALELGDRICLMDEGRIAQWGTPAELLLKPASEFVRTFFDGERVFLELGVVTVRDVWIQLSSVSPGKFGAILPAAASLRQALEAALSAGDGRVCIDNDGRIKWIDSGRIMDAYHAYKNGKHA